MVRFLCIVLFVHIILLGLLFPKCPDGEFAVFAPSARFGWVCVSGKEVERSQK